MNEIEIKMLANSILDSREPESETIEYKKSFDEIHWGSILKTVCAYSNNYMEHENGIIFIGIEEENNGPDKSRPIIPICGLVNTNMDTIKNRIKNLLFDGSKFSYRPNVDIQICNRDNTEYVVIVVSPGSKICSLTEYGAEFANKHSDSNNSNKYKALPYVRIDKSTIYVEQSDSRYLTLLKKFSKYSFLSDYCIKANLDDLDLEVMREFCLKTGTKKDYKNLSKQELAIQLDAIKQYENTSKYYPTNYGILMFCNDPSEFIENSGLVIIKSTDYGKRSSREVYNKPLWIQVQKMYDLIDDIVDSITVKNNLRSSVYYNYPKETLREIGTNAIYHNDYSEENHPVEMIVRDDHVTIVNYNQPLPPVTVDDLNNKNYIEIRSYINKELEKPFLMLSYIEKSGTGLETAKRELRNNNSPDIEFSTVDGVVTYTKAFIKINEKYVLYKEKVDGINQKGVNSDQKSVNSDQKSVNSLLSRDEYNELVSSLRLRKERENNIKGLYEIYAEDNVISNSVLRNVLGISTNVATRLIKNMVEKQLIINADGLGKGKYRFNKDMLKKQ